MLPQGSLPLELIVNVTLKTNARVASSYMGVSIFCVDRNNTINISLNIEKEVINMAQVILNIRMDENVKKQFDAICSEAGISTSIAINLFVKTVLRDGKIPFEISVKDDPFYNNINKVRLRKSIDALNAGKGAAHELIGGDDD